MGRPKGIPTINCQKGRNLARVVLDGKSFYLGAYGSPESQNNYNWLIGLWLSGGRRLPPDAAEQLAARKAGVLMPAAPAQPPAAKTVPSGTTVAELIARYLVEAEGHYVKKGRQTSEYGVIKMGLQVVLDQHSILEAGEFDVPHLKQVRGAMIKKGWACKTINHCLWAIRRCFRWGVLEGITTAEQAGRLSILPGVEAGRDGVPEREPVEPVNDMTVQATLPFLGRHVAGIVRLMRETGMRCQEVCLMRERDCRDNGNGTWTYRPSDHKMAHKGQDRVVVLGPEAVAITGQFLTGDRNAYLFSPADAESERLAELHERRETPMWASHAARRERLRGNRTPRTFQDHYTTMTVRHAIHRAVDKANEERITDAKKKHIREEDVELLPAWNPHQVRHTFGTEMLNSGFDMKTVSALLGHKHVDSLSGSQVTEIYAKVEEKTLQRAVLRRAEG